MNFFNSNNPDITWLLLPETFVIGDKVMSNVYRIMCGSRGGKDFRLREPLAIGFYIAVKLYCCVFLMVTWCT